MRLEARGGGTGSPWLVVSASQNTPSMIFHVSQELWDHVVKTIEAGGHPLDLAYNRKFVQTGLNNLQRVLDNPLPVPSPSSAPPLPSVSARSGAGVVFGVTVAALVVTGAAGWVATRVRRDRRPGPEVVVPTEEQPEPADDEGPTPGQP